MERNDLQPKLFLMAMYTVLGHTHTHTRKSFMTSQKDNIQMYNITVTVKAKLKPNWKGG